MKIQVIAPTPFFAHRGCHVRILEQARVLSAAGHDVALCTYGLGEDVPGVRTVRAPRIPWYRKLSAGPSWHKLYIDLLLFVTAWRFARRFQPDVVHAHLHEGIFLASPLARMRGGIPVVGDLQGSLTGETADHGFFDGWPWGERIFSRLERWITRQPSDVVVSAMPLLAETRAARSGGAGTVSLLGDGVDARVFRPDAELRRRARDRLGIGDGEQVIAYLGLLTPYQGVDLLCQAAAKVVRAVPEARFLVMGFPDEEHYRSRAARLGVAERIHFTGRVRYEEAPAYLAAADVAVSAKTSLTEANGKLLNYMAMGLPTVAFDTPVNREILGDLGVYARHRDVEDLARSLVDMLEEGERQREIAGKLRSRALEQYSWEARARQLEEVYRRALERAA